jgi:hypothetical protein
VGRVGKALSALKEADIRRYRHAALLVLLAAVVIVIAELIARGSNSLVGGLGHQDRVELYKQVTTVTASLLGFFIAAVAILVSLDPTRAIVRDLKRGEAFSLLIVNMLAAILLLFLTTALGVAGAVFDDGQPGAAGFEWVYQWLLLASLLELGLTGVLFAVVTYKAAAYE